MDGLTKSYLDILHSFIQQILSVIHNHFSLVHQSFEFLCIPRQSDPGKVTQEFVSLLMVKSKLTQCLETNILLNLFL